jgi:hypothetical protein
MLTEDPHPYEGKEFIIQINNQKQWERALKKLFALGYQWSSEDRYVPEYTSTVNKEYHWILCKFNKTLQYDAYIKNRIQLSFNEFWEGYWPDQAEKKIADIEVSFVMDSYIVQDGSELIFCDSNENCLATDSVVEDFRYNLLSEYKFKKLHPEQLMFKNWVIKNRGDRIMLRCEGYPGEGPEFYKKDLHGFILICEICKEKQVEYHEAYSFLMKNPQLFNQ